MDKSSSTFGSFGSRLLLFLAAVMACAGCNIKEDLDDCADLDSTNPEIPAPSTDYEITYRYFLHNKGGDRFADEVDSLDIFVYNDAGRLVLHQKEKGPFDYGHTVGLDVGLTSFSVYTWGNLSDDVTLTHETEAVGLARLCLNEDSGSGEKTVARRLARLFHGVIDVDLTRATHTDTVYLMNNTNYLTIRTHLREDDHTPCVNGHNQDIEVFVQDRDTEYRFDNSISPTAEFYRYHAYDTTTDPRGLESEGDNLLVSELSMLRLMIDHDTRLVVERKLTDEDPIVLFDENLITEILMQHPLIGSQLDLDKEEEYLIDLYLYCDGSGTYASVKVTIAGWTVIVEQTGIG